MLVRASGVISDGIYLFTFGKSCHYCISTERGFYLFDPGLSAHVPALLKRLNDHGLLMRNCLGIYFTHPDPDRISAAAHLRTLNKDIPIITSPKLKLSISDDQRLQAIYEEDIKISQMFELERPVRTFSLKEYKALLSVTRTVDDSDVDNLSEELSIRVLSSPGHSRESLSYLVEPINYLITDEVIGYFNGRETAPPGADFSIESTISTLQAFLKLDINGLCMPSFGVLTATLITKHLNSALQNISDLKNEALNSISLNLSDQEILDGLRNNLYQMTVDDPLIRYNLNKSLFALWNQLKRQ